MNNTLFVSRHPGAVIWAMRQGFAIDRVVPHLDPSTVRAGDTVLGTLPLHLVADVCARGARYLHLVVNVPAELRGQELTDAHLQALGAHLCEYQVQAVVMPLPNPAPQGTALVLPSTSTARQACQSAQNAADPKEWRS